MTENKTIFVTGGGGFIGNHFRRLALSRGNKLLVLSRKNIPLYEGETRIDGSAGNLNVAEIREHAPDYIINLSGEKRDPEKMDQVNIRFVEELLQLSTLLHVKRFIHLGSAGVYGISKHPELNISENSTCFPSNTYEKTKYEADVLITQYAEKNKLPYIILRPSNVFGIEEPSNKLLNLMKALQSGKFFLIDREAMVNYIGVKSVCLSLINALEVLPENQIYNVNAEVSISRFIRMIAFATGIEDKRIKTMPQLMHGLFKIMCYCADALPERYQYINRAKYRELTDHRFINSKKLSNLTGRDSLAELKGELNELAQWYKSRNML